MQFIWQLRYGNNAIPFWRMMRCFGHSICLKLKFSPTWTYCKKIFNWAVGQTFQFASFLTNYLQASSRDLAGLPFSWLMIWWRLSLASRFQVIGVGCQRLCVICIHSKISGYLPARFPPSAEKLRRSRQFPYGENYWKTPSNVLAPGKARNLKPDFLIAAWLILKRIRWSRNIVPFNIWIESEIVPCFLWQPKKKNYSQCW